LIFELLTVAGFWVDQPPEGALPQLREGDSSSPRSNHPVHIERVSGIRSTTFIHIHS
jgi:hypothetical protein